MNDNLLQRTQAMSMNIANEKKKKGKFNKSTADKYNALAEEVYDRFGIKLVYANYIPPSKKKISVVPKDSECSELTTIQDDVLKLESLDRQIEAVLLLISKRLEEGKVCIGRSHTLLTILREILLDRREVKDKIYPPKNKSYMTKSEEIKKLIEQLGLKVSNKIYINKAKGHSGGYKADLMHVICDIEKFRLDVAYKICKELAKVYEETEYWAIKKIDKIF